MNKNVISILLCLCAVLYFGFLLRDEIPADKSPVITETPEPAAEEAACEHSYLGGICRYCGLVCPHESYLEGLCTVCGIGHVHSVHGQSENAFSAPLCSECGVKVMHNWINGVCTVCSQQFEFIEEQLPEKFVLGGYAEHCGTVETISYPTHFYDAFGTAREECEKKMTVYLPYGYDGSQRYDLLIMCVGNSGESTLYFESEDGYFGLSDFTGAADMLDILIEQKLCKPFIAVTIEYRCFADVYDLHYDEDRAQIENELKNDILPYLCENYSLYPQNASPAELLNNREHLAFWGVSYGGYLTHSAVLQKCFEIFGWYSSVSGGWETGANMALALEGKELPVYYFYSVDGQRGLDSCAGISKRDYYEFERLCPLVSDGINGHAGTIVNGAHDASTWLTALFNFARLAFQSP